MFKMSSLFKLNPQQRSSARNMSDLNRSFIGEIYRVAKYQGITQAEIARRLDVNKSTINRILAGKGNPTFRTVADICAVIGVRPELNFAETARNHLSANDFVPLNSGGKGLSSTTTLKVAEYGT